MADFYRQTYGPAAELTGGLIQVPSYFAWIALQYSALAGLLELYFTIPFPVGLFIVASITLAYTLIGGMWSVTLTDSFSNPGGDRRPYHPYVRSALRSTPWKWQSIPWRVRSV